MSRRREARSPLVLEFLTKVETLMEEYDLSIEHEDGHGNFIVSHGYGSSWLGSCEETDEV